MERSFQAILSQLLEEENVADAPAKTTTTASSTFTPPAPESPLWEIPRPKATFRRGIYPTQSTPVRKAKPQPEVLVALTTMTQEHQSLVQVMAKLGAPELLNGLSLNALKRAYRRLAKRLHPDVASGSADQFMDLRKAYEGLRKALPSYEACSESALGSKSPHRAAA